MLTLICIALAALSGFIINEGFWIQGGLALILSIIFIFAQQEGVSE